MGQNGQEIGIGTAWVAAGLLIFGILWLLDQDRQR